MAKKIGIKIKQGVALISGGFDPIHLGHIHYLQEAAMLGSRLVVALNSDAWLERKKGYIFYSWEDRKEILMAIGCVDEVIDFDDSDETACAAIRTINPEWFCNGGDRGPDNTPESDLCKELDIGLAFNCGGLKIRSSSESVARVSCLQRLNGIKKD